MTSSKLEQLLKQQEQLRARIADEKAKERKAERHAENRRKMLMGIALQKAVKAGQIQQSVVDQLLDQYINTRRDRDFLGLASPEQQPAYAAAEGENAPEATQPVAGEPKTAPAAAQTPRANDPATYQQYLANHPGPN